MNHNPWLESQGNSFTFTLRMPIFQCSICPCIPSLKVKIKNWNMSCSMHSIIVVFTTNWNLEVSHIQKCWSIPCGWFEGGKEIASRRVSLFTNGEYSHVSVKMVAYKQVNCPYSYMKMYYTPLVQMHYNRLVHWQRIYTLLILMVLRSLLEEKSLHIIRAK